MKRMLTFTMLLFAAASFFSCTEKVEMEEEIGLNADFYITTTRDVIQANGTDKTQIQVFLQDVDVTEEVKFYDENDKPISKEIIGKDGVYSTNTPGVLKFYAHHGTYSTFNRNFEDNGLYKITAIEQAVPDPVAEKDADKNRLDFVHRAFLTQYTGNECGYCPYMIRTLRQIAADNVIPEKAVLAAVHSYGSGDPAYIPYPKVSNYPYLTLDLVQGFSSSQTAEVLKNLVNERTTGAAKAGISVSPAYYAGDAMLVVTVAVKAAVAGTFNVGAWLLEDEIYGTQSDYDNIGDDTYDTHNSCVRIADSKFQHAKKETWFGYELGNLSVGNVAEKTFVMKLDKKWVLENLHLAIFVSYDDVDGYSVCNAVDVPIDAPTPFEYVK